MKKILIIDERFPSTGGSRTEKFVKYLPTEGWEPIVLSIDQTGKNPFNDEILRKYTCPDLKIYWTGTLPDFSILEKFHMGRLGNILNRLIYIPDVTVNWIPFALIQALRIIRKEKPVVIYSTSPSEGIHLIAVLVKKFSGLPWVADFRDLWTQYALRYKPLTPVHNYLNRFIEKKVYIEWSDLVIANTAENKEIIIDQFHVRPERVKTITSGFDHEDVREEQTAQGKRTSMQLAYFGGFEKPAVCYREFLEGFRQALSGNVRFQLKLWAQVSDELKADIKREPLLSDTIEVKPYLSHQRAMSQLAENDAFILLLKSNFEHIIPQKLYNYLAFKKPILAVVPSEGCAARIIRETNMGVVVSPDDTNAIAVALVRLYEKWEAGALDSFNSLVNDENLEKYRRDRLTGKLATVLNETIGFNTK